jgi:deoxyribonuclease V
LVAEQKRLAGEVWTPWRPKGRYTIGACFCCFVQAGPGDGLAGDFGFAAAVVEDDIAVVSGEAPAAYEPGLLALREGALLDRALHMLDVLPDVLVVDATGRDHPRRCGLALYLGAVVGTPTVGVTHRPLRAHGDWPDDERGATSPLTLDGERVGYWLRTRRRTRPLAVHSAWRTGPEVAVEVVLAATGQMRTPEPLRTARTAAREARTAEALAGRS